MTTTIVTIICSGCQDRFHAYDQDDTTCLQCLDASDVSDATPVTPVATSLAAAVRAYAVQHYADGKGWDFVVEALSDEDLVELIGKSSTANGAIWAVWNKKIRSYWQLERDQRTGGA